MDRIRLVSGTMAAACVIAAALIIAAGAYVWLAWGVFDGAAEPHIAGRPLSAWSATTSWLERLGGFALSLIPAGLGAAALMALARVFGHFARGAIFGLPAIDGLRRVGWFLVAATLARIIVTPLLTVLVTIDNPPGERIFSVSLDSNDVLALLAAVTVLVIAWVMSEARRNADDLAQIV